MVTNGNANSSQNSVFEKNYQNAFSVLHWKDDNISFN